MHKENIKERLDCKQAAGARVCILLIANQIRRGLENLLPIINLILGRDGGHCYGWPGALDDPKAAVD